MSRAAIIFGRAIARFYVDFLWHDALGLGDAGAGSAIRAFPYENI